MSTLDLQYIVGIKRQVVNALRAVFSAPTFPDQELAGKLNVELEFPIIQTRYPAIYIDWAEDYIRDAGVGHYTIEPDDFGNPRIVRHWFFEGHVVYNIMALDTVERDYISAALINLMAFGRESAAFKPFRKTLYDEAFVSLQMNTGYINPMGHTTGPAPWANKDEFVYVNSYSSKTFGEFFTLNETGDIIEIERVSTYPYRPDQAVPSGSLAPQDLGIPWE